MFYVVRTRYNIFALVSQLTAVAAFRALGQRGHRLRTLKLEQCGLSPASAGMIAHTLQDNNNITDILLNYNPVRLFIFHFPDFLSL